MLPQISLVLGGAASGKSAFAERLAQAPGRPLTYVATARAPDAQSPDPEMAAKIAHHQARRGPGWQTVEAPVETAAAIAALPAGRIILIDCATLWLAAQLEAGHDLAARADELLAALSAARSPVIVVSNELGTSPVPEHALTRAFRQAQGELNQALAAASSLAVLVVAGLPLVLRGHLPEGLA